MAPPQSREVGPRKPIRVTRLDRQLANDKGFMESSPFLVEAVVNDVHNAAVMLDSGCLVYGLISPQKADSMGFARISLPNPRELQAFNDRTSRVYEVAKGWLDLGSHRQVVYLYVTNHAMAGEIALGRPWMLDVDVVPHEREDKVHIRSTDTWLSSKDVMQNLSQRMGLRKVAGAAFSILAKNVRKNKIIGGVFSASLADIQKALRHKKHSDPNKVLPQWLKDLVKAFSQENASKIPPYRPGFDHKIELIKDTDGKEPELPWGPLYGMTVDELLVLRKTLTEYLDKGYIRASRSPAAAPVLFAKKPGGGLRFCVDYRALNRITRKDRYPIPLISETLNRIAKAKYLTKLDVIAAFHKIRIEKGQEYLTAFRTRYGQFEWIVTPFGLTGAPATFQRFVNHVLRDFLDDFCSAYLDDILIFTNGSRSQHRKQVRMVLERLHEAGLQVDVDKCEFETESTKYLGYIIHAGKSITMDPEKVTAIREWVHPNTVKGVRSFLGFANYYRRFIKDFARISAPLVRLTKKDAPFRWTEEEQTAFDRLKSAFLSQPVLQHFHPELHTVVETDASGYAIGGALSQYGKDGILRPCAFLSKKMNPAEGQYEIHDKELLAVVRSLEEWEAELRSVQEPFTVISDHKNLQYFTTAKKLTERHVRWSLILGRFNMVLEHRPGKHHPVADALSRREQDLPQGSTDERVMPRTFQLLKPCATPVKDEEISEDPAWVLHCAAVAATPLDLPLTPDEPSMDSPTVQQEIPQTPPDVDWTQAIHQDNQYQDAVAAVQSGARRFPSRLNLKVSIAECTTDPHGKLYFRDRLWVPQNEPLRTQTIRDAHDSPFAGHPGRQQTYQILQRDFFWPGMSNDVRRYVRNCDSCGRAKPWRELTRGFLKPLPIPDRIWSELSMDFITDLPQDSQGNKCLMVTTDRLSKDVRFDPLTDITTETVAWAFIQGTLRNHGIPRAIASDRGSQFTSKMWQTVCRELTIGQRLSTAYHPQTDGSTERMNSTLESYLRTMCSWRQDDWSKWCPIAELAIRNRNATSTGISPFFMLHGYHVNLSAKARETSPEGSPETSLASPSRNLSNTITQKLRDIWDFAQASMAEAQAEQEKQANRHRQESPQLRVGDKVWLRLGPQLSTGRPCKKLDWKNAKYTVKRLIGSHAAELDTPPGIHPVFHVDRLKLAATDPFPSQPCDDSQPPPIQVEGDDEYFVDSILSERSRRYGRGYCTQYLVKWTGYAMPSWEPAAHLDDTAALQHWLDFTREFRGPDGKLPPGFQRT